MQIVIDINEELYKECQGDVYYPDTGGELWQAVKDGILLPKGHGRLIDADNLPLNAIDDANYGSNYIKIAPIIIKADREN